MERLKRTYNILVQFGVDPLKAFNSIRGLPYFVRDFLSYQELAKSDKRALPVSAYYPVMHERFAANGNIDTHYLFQDLWAARLIYKAKPERHVDIGSSIMGFVSHLLTFREVELVDVRPLELGISGLSCTVTDATTMAAYQDNSLESISTLHAGEHFGLGRYGDPVDPVAHIKFMKSLTRVLKPGGKLYYAVPCGIERLVFNAHRVLSYTTIIETFGGLELRSFSCVTDNNVYCENCGFDMIEKQNYGCGMFEFSKPLAYQERPPALP